MEIILATKNNNKLKEINGILKDAGFSVVSMSEAGLDFDIVEDGLTFLDNAVIKARAVMEASGKIALSDDSGLEIDFLDKAPGVHSARFLENSPYSIKNARILEMLKNVPKDKRTARFVCVIVAAFPESFGFKENILAATGIIEGIIANESCGTNGFGYDPIFYVQEYGMTTAEMDVDLKNKISHRGIAIEKMKEKLSKLFQDK